MTDDPFDLARFEHAQSFCIDAALRELRAGQKQTHWMWFVFPQMRGLGSSPRAVKYGISGREEALAYLAHPVLGPRLVACIELVIAAAPRSVRDIFGAPDDLKFHSSMTLFDAVKPNDFYATALDLYFGGARDQKTLQLLSEG
ncbi:MAG: DUF1810 domain-containing protein [Hyphomicrobium sp.]